MWGKWILLDLGDDFHVSVYVSGNPTEGAADLEARAARKLARRLENVRKTPLIER
jgi:uncharacterized protein YktB (UPF0637 family)